MTSMRMFSSYLPTQNAQSSGSSLSQELQRNVMQPGREQRPRGNSTIETLAEMQASRASQPRGVSPDYQGLQKHLEVNLIDGKYSDRLPPHHLHIFSHRHNTHLTLTRPNGEPMLSMSCGNLGFKKAGRGGYDPAYQLSAHVFAKIQERNWLKEIRRLELIFRDFGQGRDAFIKVLQSPEGKRFRGLVTQVTDSTRIKFGGTRSPRPRRLG